MVTPPLERYRSRQPRLLQILGLGIDMGTATGQLIFTIIGAIACFEREMMLERQRANSPQFARTSSGLCRISEALQATDADWIGTHFAFSPSIVRVFLPAMCLKYARINPISSSLRSSSAKLGMRCSGQVRTERGSRINARKPASVKYSVGFIGKFKLGPADANPATFNMWHVKHLFTKAVCPPRAGWSAGSMGSTASEGHRLMGASCTDKLRTW
jgi:hypothetical protein